MFSGTNPVTTDLVTTSDLSSFKRQESIFVILSLVLLAFILLLHTVFASFWGRLHPALLAAVGLVFLGYCVKLVWVMTRTTPLSTPVISAIAWTSSLTSVALAILLTGLTDHEDSPYYILLIVPILQSAFRLSLPAVIGMVAVADILNFYWVALYFQRHPPLEVAEYFEAALTSLIFTVVGILVWILVNHSREKEVSLARNLVELQRTRERLLEEETLAAVGRLSSAIAHEIRNPVAMISSSLAMAKQDGLEMEQRHEMWDIAAREASRLENLTSDFLSYARPRRPEATLCLVHDTLAYVASVCRAHAKDKGVTIEVDASESLEAEIDPAQVQEALLNLVMNAVDASARDGTVVLRASRGDGSDVRISVENTGSPIPGDKLPRIFEPFFTTKPRGTGLGLAIARNIARAHGGDLVISSNSADKICFSLILPATRNTGIFASRE